MRRLDAPNYFDEKMLLDLETTANDVGATDSFIDAVSFARHYFDRSRELEELLNEQSVSDGLEDFDE